MNIQSVIVEGDKKTCHLLVARGGIVPWNPCNMVEEVQDLAREGHAYSSE